MPSYKDLNRRRPGYDAALLTELGALYEGGRAIERLYPALLPQRDHESTRRHQLRLKEAEYRNYMGPIIDYFASMLFVSSSVLRARTPGNPEATDPGEYWARLREDCNHGGMNVDAFFKNAVTQAMVTQTSWLRIHQPSQLPAENRADFEASGNGDCWISALGPDDVLDWETGEGGRLVWAIVHNRSERRLSVASSRDSVTERWDVLTADTIETYSITYDKKNPPSPEQEIPRIGEPVPHTFGSVPLVCLDLPPALHVAGRLRSPQLAHFRKTCALAWSLSATAFAMPVAKVKDPEEFKKSVSGAGYQLVLGLEDEWTWEAPPTGHFTALREEIQSEKDEIFRIAHQMALGVENNAAAVGRSAESKASDLESTRVVLVAFSRIVKEAMEFTLDLISRARGEGLIWSVEGLDDFAALDVDQFIANLGDLKTKVGAIPSRTFAVEANTRAAEALLRDLDEATKQKIRAEIEAGTQDPGVERKEELEAAARMFGTAAKSN